MIRTDGHRLKDSHLDNMLIKPSSGLRLSCRVKVKNSKNIVSQILVVGMLNGVLVYFLAVGLHYQVLQWEKVTWHDLIISNCDAEEGPDDHWQSSSYSF